MYCICNPTCNAYLIQDRQHSSPIRLKNIDPAIMDILDIVLPAKMAEQWTTFAQGVRDMVINHVRLHS
jgi:hypothetical protein